MTHQGSVKATFVIVFAIFAGGAGLTFILWKSGKVDSATTSGWTIPNPDVSGMEPRVQSIVKDSRAALVRQPQYVAAWIRFGDVCYAHELLEEAAICYERAAMLSPSDYRWAYRRALVNDELGRDPDFVINLYEKVIELEPRYAPMYHQIGDAYLRANRLAEARDKFETCIELAPEIAACQLGLAKTLLQLNDPSTALLHLQKANELVPNASMIYTAFIQAYTELNQLQAAEEYSQQLPEAVNKVRLPDPISYEIQLQGVSSAKCEEVAQILIAEGRLNEAAEKLRIVEEARPDDAALKARIGHCYLRDGNLENAELYFTRALRIDETIASAVAGIGHIRLQEGKTDDAAKEFRRALILDPTRVQTRVDLAHTLIQSDQFNEAARVLEEAEADASLNAAGHFYWGTALLRTGKYDEALKHFQESLVQEPENVNTLFNTGVVLQRLGRNAEAVGYYRQALQVDPNHSLSARRLLELTAPREQ